MTIYSLDGLLFLFGFSYSSKAKKRIAHCFQFCSERNLPPLRTFSKMQRIFLGSGQSEWLTFKTSSILTKVSPDPSLLLNIFESIAPVNTVKCFSRQPDSQSHLMGAKQHLVGSCSEPQVPDLTPSWYSSTLTRREVITQDFPGCPVAKTPNSQCRGSRFNPWSGNEIPHAATKTQHSQISQSHYLTIYDMYTHMKMR